MFTPDDGGRESSTLRHRRRAGRRRRPRRGRSGCHGRCGFRRWPGRRASERIPRIAEMDACLGDYGWGAVAVDGFIPPRAFQEFQALGIMTIAANIRSSDHIAYTPAPDIVHESAGHAPIVPDPTYREFLRCIGEVGSKALSPAHAHQVLAGRSGQPDAGLCRGPRAHGDPRRLRGAKCPREPAPGPDPQGPGPAPRETRRPRGGS